MDESNNNRRERNERRSENRSTSKPRPKRENHVYLRNSEKKVDSSCEDIWPPDHLCMESILNLKNAKFEKAGDELSKQSPEDCQGQQSLGTFSNTESPRPLGFMQKQNDRENLLSQDVWSVDDQCAETILNMKNAKFGTSSKNVSNVPNTIRYQNSERLNDQDILDYAKIEDSDSHNDKSPEKHFIKSEANNFEEKLPEISTATYMEKLSSHDSKRSIPKTVRDLDPSMSRTYWVDEKSCLDSEIASRNDKTAKVGQKLKKKSSSKTDPHFLRTKDSHKHQKYLCSESELSVDHSKHTTAGHKLDNTHCRNGIVKNHHSLGSNKRSEPYKYHRDNEPMPKRKIQLTSDSELSVIKPRSPKFSYTKKEIANPIRDRSDLDSSEAKKPNKRDGRSSSASGLSVKKRRFDKCNQDVNDHSKLKPELTSEKDEFRYNPLLKISDFDTNVIIPPKKSFVANCVTPIYDNRFDKKNQQHDFHYFNDFYENSSNLTEKSWSSSNTSFKLKTKNFKKWRPNLNNIKYDKQKSTFNFIKKIICSYELYNTPFRNRYTNIKPSCDFENVTKIYRFIHECIHVREMQEQRKPVVNIVDHKLCKKEEIVSTLVKSKWVPSSDPIKAFNKIIKNRRWSMKKVKNLKIFLITILFASMFVLLLLSAVLDIDIFVLIYNWYHQIFEHIIGCFIKKPPKLTKMQRIYKFLHYYAYYCRH